MANQDSKSSVIISNIKKSVLGLTMLLSSDSNINRDKESLPLDDKTVPDLVKEALPLDDKTVPNLVEDKRIPDSESKSAENQNSKPVLPQSDIEDNLHNDGKDSIEVSDSYEDSSVRKIIDSFGGDTYAVKLTQEILPENHKDLLENLGDIVDRANDTHDLSMEVPPVVVQNILPEKGMGYDYNHDVLYIYSGLLKQYDSSDVEAMLAHEVGHKTKYELDEYREVDLLKDEMKENLLDCQFVDREKIRNQELFPQSIAFGNNVSDAIDKMENDLEISEECSENVAGDLLKIAEARKQEERDADQFAKSMGYGDKLANILQKVEDRNSSPSVVGNLERYDSLSDRISKLRDEEKGSEDISR